MLYLAQVRKYSSVDGMVLALLAEQTAEQAWVVKPAEPLTVHPDDLPPMTPTTPGMLVLVELDQNASPVRIRDAQDWMLNMLTRFSDQSSRQHWLEAQEDKIEQWRQELTIKSQEMSIKNLELETRRERFEAEQAELEQRWQAIRDQEEA
jgi:hypothetical protein